MNFNDIYDINTPSTYELDESSYEVLEKSFDKNDVDINFFEKKNSQNIINYEYEINQQDLYCVKPVAEHKDEKDNTYNGNFNSKTETKTKTGSKIKLIPPISNRKIKEIIFNIKKENKKLGRIKKTKKNIKGKHNKFKEDNIIQKIKASLLDKIYKYINRQHEKFLLENSQDLKLATRLLKRIKPDETKKIKTSDNLTWLALKLKDLFSMELSSKYSKYEKNYNKKQIEILYKKNQDKNTIAILEKTVREMLFDFCNDVDIIGFETLKDDLAQRREKMKQENEKDEEIERYLEIYEKTARNLEQIFLNKKQRNNTRKKSSL